MDGKDPGLTRKAIGDGLQAWAEVSPLTFTEIDSSSSRSGNIDIRWASGYSGSYWGGEIAGEKLSLWGGARCDLCGRNALRVMVLYTICLCLIETDRTSSRHSVLTDVSSLKYLAYDLA